MPNYTFPVRWANNPISALNFGGPPLRFLDLARAGTIRLDISEPILQEVLRVLADKFQWEASWVKEAAALITGFTQRVTPTQTLDVIKEDPPDNRILECAAEVSSDFIVSAPCYALIQAGTVWHRSM